MKTQIKKALTALALAVGFTTAATAATADENGITPHSWFTFDDLEATVADGTKAVNKGSGAQMTLPAGTSVVVSGTDRAWQFGTASKDTGAIDGNNLRPVTYITKINLNGTDFGTDRKTVWGCNGQKYGGLCMTVTGSGGNTKVGFGPHDNGAVRTPVVDYTVPAEKLTGFHWYAVTVSSDGKALAVYLDGVAIGSGAASLGTTQNGNLGWGKLGNGSGTPAEGLQVSEFRFYKQVLTATQIAKIAGVAGKTYTATLTDGETAWKDIAWEPALTEAPEALDEFEITGAQTASAPVLLFDSSTNIASKLTLKGDAITVKAADALYENGCFLTTFATFGTLVCETEPTFADIKSGFKGAYAKSDASFTLRAQNNEVISINIAGGSGGGSGGDSPAANLVSGTDYYGIAPTLGDSWNNINRQWLDGGNQTISITGPNAYDGENVLPRPTMSLSATGKNTWQAGITNPFLRGYLDDGNGVTVAVHGIPYTSYDVIVYATSDDANIRLAPVTINGTQYTFADGETKAGSTVWGQGLYATPEIGKNALRVNGCTGDTLTINATRVSGTPGGRATLCAVQVICQGDVLLKDEFTATISESTAFSNIDTWNKPFAEGQLHEATINVAEGESEVELTFDNPDLLLAKLIVNSERDIKFTATKPLNNVSQFIVTGCTAKVTYNYPVNALQMTTDGLIAYTGGAGSETKTAGIGFVTDGDLTLTGGGSVAPYYIGDTFQENTNPYTMTFTDATVYCKGWAGLAVGTATVTIEGATTVNAEKFILSQGTEGQVSDITIKDTSAVNITGTTDEDTNQSSIMFGHWDGASTFTLQDTATFTAASQVLVGKTGNTQTINLDGGTFTAKGIKVSSGGTEFNYALHLNGGALVLGEVGISSYANSRFITVYVTADSTITATAAMPITQPIVIDGEKTLTFDATAGDIVVSGAVTGEGTIKVVGGNVTFMDTTGVSPERVTVVSGKAFYGFTVGINECGTFKLTEGLTADNVKLYDKAGSEVAFEPDGKGNLTFEWKYTEGACWWDYEFNEASGVTPKNSGADKTALSLDGDRAQSLKDAGEYATNIVQQGEVAVTNISLRVPNRPWRDVSNWPATATFMFYGKMVGTDKAYQIAFGSKNNSGNQLFVATKSVADGTVDLCYSVKGAEPTVLCTMNVPNAQDADHLYAFVLKSDDLGNTVVNTFLDGKLLQPYTHDGVLTLGGGFQIASGHGGCAAGGYDRPANNDPATIDWLRVYDVELSAEVMEKLADIYPYISTNGKATRTVGATDTTWVSDGAWTQASFGGAETTQSAPNANTMVELTVSADTTLALNLDAQANYETLEIRGESALTLTGSEGSVVPSVSGATTIGTDVTVAYDAIKFGNVTVADGKTLTFDCAELDISKEFACRSIKLTGVATLGEGAQVVPSNLPEATAGRTVEFVLDGATGQYQLKIAVEEHPFVITVEEGATTGMWTWNGQPVDVATVEANPTVLIEKQGEGTYEATITRAYCVKEGMLKVQDYTGTPTITVEGGVFDINGKSDKAFRVVLAGGRLVNNGNAITTGSLQFTSIAQTADSEIGGTGEFGYILKGWGVNTLDLGGAKLTKTGDNVFSLCNCTVQNGALEVAGGTLRISDRDVTIAEDATLTIGADGTLDVKKILTADTLEGAGQVVLDASTTNEVGTLTGTLTITGAGVIKVLEKADYAIISTNVTLAAQAAVYFPAGVTHARKDFASKLAHEGAISIDAAEGAEFAGTFVFPKAEEITFTEAFTKAIKAAGYVKRETANEVIYFKPTVITIR